MLLNKYIAYLVKSFYPVTFLHSYFFRTYVCVCVYVVYVQTCAGVRVLNYFDLPLASLKTTNGLFPPSSKVTRLRLTADAAPKIMRPTCNHKLHAYNTFFLRNWFIKKHLEGLRFKRVWNIVQLLRYHLIDDNRVDNFESVESKRNIKVML